MKSTNDSIIFEGRDELADMLDILHQWMKDHPHDKKRNTAQDVADIVAIIETCW